MILRFKSEYFEGQLLFLQIRINASPSLVLFELCCSIIKCNKFELRGQESHRKATCLRQI